MTMNRSRRRGFNCTTSGFRISGFNCHCHGDGAADGWDGWDVSASWAWLVEMTWAMGHCQGETPCKCFTSELSWIILSYLELSWAILKWWTKYTKSNNQTKPTLVPQSIRNLFKGHILSSKHGRAAPTSTCSSGTWLEFRSSSGT